MVASFINDNFIPLEAHIKEHPTYFHRFNAVWTPTVLIMDPEGTERWRLEGYLPKDEFHGELEIGLGRVAFMRKDWAGAESRYNDVIERYPDSKHAAQAVYWRGVARYQASHDHTILGETADTLHGKYADSEWAMRSLPWLKKKETAGTSG